MNNKLGRLVGGCCWRSTRGLRLPPINSIFSRPDPDRERNLRPAHADDVTSSGDLCVVFGVMFYSIYAHRKVVGHKAEQFHENTTVEIIWTVIPFVILLGMPGLRQDLIAFKDTANRTLRSKPPATVEMGLRLPQGRSEGVAFLSALSTPQDQSTTRNEGRELPAGGDNRWCAGGQESALISPRQRRDPLLRGSRPFGIKQDAISGFVRDTWFKADKEGTYRGQVAELCGKGHVFIAYRGRGGVAAKIHAVGGQQKKNRRPPPRIRTSSGTSGELQARGEKCTPQLRCLPPGERKGMPPAFPALDGPRSRPAT